MRPSTAQQLQQGSAAAWRKDPRCPYLAPKVGHALAVDLTKSVVIEDPYIRLQHQIQNFVRFCETVLKAGTVKKISLITGHDDKTPLAEMAEKLEELKQKPAGAGRRVNVKETYLRTS